MIKRKPLINKPNKSRVLVIADIHGSAKALQQCLDRAYVTENDTIISLGDIADGWGETSKCVDILLDLQKTNKCIFIRGNHDVWVYDWLKYGRTPMIWTEQGGKATLESYIRTQKFIQDDHKDFWFNQKDWYIDDKNRIFIHAGWCYMEDVFPRAAQLPINAGTIAKECHWDRSLLQGAKSCESAKRGNSDVIFRGTQSFNEVYIGHTATKSHLPENYMNLYNLDSGCGWFGKLTIMDVDTKEYWQSDYSKDLYPDEKGRG